VDFVQAYYRSAAVIPGFSRPINIAVHADTFRKVEGFRPRFRTSEDRDFCDRWLAAGNGLAYAPDAVVRHAHLPQFCLFLEAAHGVRAWGMALLSRRMERGMEVNPASNPAIYAKLVSMLLGLILQQPRNRAFLCFPYGSFGSWRIWQDLCRGIVFRRWHPRRER
jgi:hypothetical protein